MSSVTSEGAPATYSPQIFPERHPLEPTLGWPLFWAIGGDGSAFVFSESLGIVSSVEIPERFQSVHSLRQ